MAFAWQRSRQARAGWLSGAVFRCGFQLPRGGSGALRVSLRPRRYNRYDPYPVSAGWPPGRRRIGRWFALPALTG